MSNQPAPGTKPRGRSPSYPAIDLETAIQRAGVLWDKERQHAASVDTIVKHWGYKSLNGPASLSLAALKKFGLVEDEGSGTARTARLTGLAVDILANPDTRKRETATQRAALNPTIHRELWDAYGATPPSDDQLEWELTRQRNFTPTGAKEFIPEYRDTIRYAKLADGATVETQDDESDEDKGGSGVPDSKIRRRKQRVSADANVLTIPLLSGSSVVVEGEFPVTEQDWDQFMAVLGAMKPGLIADRPEGVDAGAGDFLPDPPDED